MQEPGQSVFLTSYPQDSAQGLAYGSSERVLNDHGYSTPKLGLVTCQIQVLRGVRLEVPVLPSPGWEAVEGGCDLGCPSAVGVWFHHRLDDCGQPRTSLGSASSSGNGDRSAGT